MNELRAEVQDGAKEQPVATTGDLEILIAAAERQARAAGILNGIKLQAQNGDELLLVVGGDETVLGFSYGHGNPPYYASVGTADTDAPFLTAYIGLTHHTEFSRRHVVPMGLGRNAALEFLESGARPTSVSWTPT